MKKHLPAVLLVACALHAHSAKADSDFPMITSVEGNYAGIGLGALPDYNGSDEYTWGVMPVARFELGGHRSVELTGNYLDANLINHDNFHFGPALRYRFGRDADVDDTVVALLPTIDDAVEAGVTMSWGQILNNNPRNRYTVGADILWDASGVSDGYNGSLYARYWDQASEMVDLGIGASMRYGSDNFNNTYFGVTPAGATASGLPTYTADGGVTSFDITPMAVVHFDESWHMGMGGRYSHLTGDAADSPLVDQRGDPNQFIAGFGLVYSWGGKVNRASTYGY